MVALDPDPCNEAPTASADKAALWVLRGNRRGDNAMIEAVAEASGLSRRSAQLRFNALGAFQNVLPGGSLYSLTSASRLALAPPWPAVVLTSGKRSVPAALWIRRASRGRTRLVHLGRPQAPLKWFDLVVTTPQYRLPMRSNVLLCRLPSTVPPEVGPVAADLGALPRPHLVALVGGSAAPQVLDASAARALAAEALKLVRATGGSLLVATSPRTARDAVDALRAALEGSGETVRLCVYGVGPNRYRDFVASADRFLVTDDSVSMVVEAAATRRPVALFQLPSRPGIYLRVLGALQDVAARSPVGRAGLEALVARGLIRSNRDIAGYINDLDSRALLRGGDALAHLAAKELAEVGRRVRDLATPAVLLAP